MPGLGYVTVPSVLVEPLNVSFTVTVLPSSVAGAPNAKAAVAVAEPCGVGNALVSHVAVAVFVPGEPSGRGHE